MALFPRRVLQRMLDRSQKYLSLPQRQTLCNLLNKVRGDYLATEWELVVLDTASRLGNVLYEPKFTGTKRPDFLFQSEPAVSFVADITSVSDRGLHKQIHLMPSKENSAVSNENWAFCTGGLTSTSVVIRTTHAEDRVKNHD